MSRFSHSSGQLFQSGDASLYFEVSGNPTGTPLVLLHGGLGSLADFNPILDRLPKHCRFIGIDFRGHGRSTLGSAPMTYQHLQADVLRILDHLEIECCALLGFSDGGIVASRMAAQTPARVASLVCVGAQWKLDVDGHVFEMLRGVTAEMWREMFPETADYYGAVNPAPDFDALVPAVVAMWTDQSESGYPNADIANITSPILVVRGDGDPLLSLQEAVEMVATVPGASFFNVPFAGHEVHKEAPELFCAVVNPFIEAPRRALLGA